MRVPAYDADALLLSISPVHASRSEVYIRVKHELSSTEVPSVRNASSFDMHTFDSRIQRVHREYVLRT